MMTRLYRDGGQTMTLGAPPILLPLGRGLGGTTLVNSGTCFRTPAARARALAQRVWAASSTSRSSTAASSASSERCRSPRSPPSWPAPTPPSRVAAPSGWAGRTATCAATRAAASARACARSAVPTSAKQHTGITYIPRARAAGAQILTGADVQRVLVRERARAGRAAALDGGVRLRGARPRGGRRGRHDPHAAAAARAAGSAGARASSGATSRCTRRPRRSR